MIQSSLLENENLLPDLFSHVLFTFLRSVLLCPRMYCFGLFTTILSSVDSVLALTSSGGLLFHIRQWTADMEIRHLSKRPTDWYLYWHENVASKEKLAGQYVEKCSRVTGGWQVPEFLWRFHLLLADRCEHWQDLFFIEGRYNSWDVCTFTFPFLHKNGIICSISLIFLPCVSWDYILGLTLRFIFSLFQRMVLH